MWHPVYYYFRKIQPWTRAQVHAPDVAARYLNNPAEWRPILLGEPVYRALMQQRMHAPVQSAESAPSVSFPIRHSSGRDPTPSAAQRQRVAGPH